jgi:methyl-accepting chemotaxis protein
MGTLFRRRNYFTKKEFQARFALPFLLASFLANTITVSLFIFLARNKIDSLLYSMRLPRASAGALLAPSAFIAGVAAVVAVSLLFLWAARGMYHKIEGPLQQIRAQLHMISAGDLSARVTLRDLDEFKDFAGQVNALVGTLNTRFTVLKTQAETLAKEADAWNASPKTAGGAARRNMMLAIKSMKEQIGALKQ